MIDAEENIKFTSKYYRESEEKSEKESLNDLRAHNDRLLSK